MSNLKTKVTEKKFVALVSVLAAVFLTCIKLFIGIITGSLGILSEALHSGLDFIAALITYLSVKVSDKPADRDHNYGHGKVENFSALIETLLLLVTCIWIIYEALHRLITHKQAIEINIWSYIVVIVAIIIDFSRSRALMKAAKKHNSQALEADALHFSTDIWSSGVVFVGLIFANFGILAADSIAALIVAGIVIYVSFKLGRRAINILLDKAPKDIPEKVREIVLQIPGITSVHNIKVRSAGADIFIDLSMHVDSRLTIQEVHNMSDKVEAQLQSKIPRCTVHIHQEPEENPSSEANFESSV